MATDKKHTSTEIVKKNDDATAALLAIAEDLSAENVDLSEFSQEIFIRPAKLATEHGIASFDLVFDARTEKTMAGGKPGALISAHSSRNVDRKVVFLESGAMKGQFTPEHIGKRFIMTYAGTVKGNQPIPTNLYDFAWKR